MILISEPWIYSQRFKSDSEFLNLEIGFSIKSHVTITNCHREYHKRFQNNNIILHINSI